jgi:hypothetical protein
MTIAVETSSQEVSPVLMTGTGVGTSAPFLVGL